MLGIEPGLGQPRAKQVPSQLSYLQPQNLSVCLMSPHFPGVSQGISEPCCSGCLSRVWCQQRSPEQQDLRVAFASSEAGDGRVDRFRDLGSPSVGWVGRPPPPRCPPLSEWPSLGLLVLSSLTCFSSCCCVFTPTFYSCFWRRPASSRGRGAGQVERGPAQGFGGQPLCLAVCLGPFAQVGHSAMKWVDPSCGSHGYSL